MLGLLRLQRPLPHTSSPFPSLLAHPSSLFLSASLLNLSISSNLALNRRFSSVALSVKSTSLCAEVHAETSFSRDKSRAPARRMRDERM
ncbi:hypothetical protein BCR35DRAFT_309619 [Leucosporidium creatinivorum]|uniref:Uncharacterized protein n=1 Tax=Leucosporidium creatinivorum TaxID=106004 RepID=A0A1Y2DEU1_9BASI|nr:hypothetical protein BCR35DRAFT_309619 [Leucosporidium creatinivorum]